MALIEVQKETEERERNMYVIGVTGGIGCGKSTVSRALAARGLPVLDADRLSHEVTAPGGVAIAEIMACFGADLIRADGGLDREAMAKLAFTDKKCLDLLSRIVHKYVLETIGEKLTEFQKNRCKACVLDVPVPVREGFLDRCHCILVIQTEDELRIERLEKRGMSEAEARRRMALQLSAEGYAKLATHVIENNGTEEELMEKVDALLQPLLSARGIPYHIPEPEEAFSDEAEGGEKHE